MKRPVRPISSLILALIGVYQRFISPALPQRCKYYPTCSAYSAEAIRELGPIRGLIVAGWRILRCNPLSDGGIDDLADRRLFRGTVTRSDRERGRRRAIPAAGRTTGPNLNHGMRS